MPDRRLIVYLIRPRKLTYTQRSSPLSISKSKVSFTLKRHKVKCKERAGFWHKLHNGVSCKRNYIAIMRCSLMNLYCPVLDTTTIFPCYKTWCTTHEKGNNRQLLLAVNNSRTHYVYSCLLIQKLTQFKQHRGNTNLPRLVALCSLSECDKGNYVVIAVRTWLKYEHFEIYQSAKSIAVYSLYIE